MPEVPDLTKVAGCAVSDGMGHTFAELKLSCLSLRMILEKLAFCLLIVGDKA